MREFEVARLGFHVLAALGWMHAQDVIHRDIKPANIMITVDSEGNYIYKLIDLSIAAVTKTLGRGATSRCPFHRNRASSVTLAFLRSTQRTAHACGPSRSQLSRRNTGLWCQSREKRLPFRILVDHSNFHQIWPK